MVESGSYGWCPRHVSSGVDSKHLDYCRYRRAGPSLSLALERPGGLRNIQPRKIKVKCLLLPLRVSKSSPTSGVALSVSTQDYSRLRLRVRSRYSPELRVQNRRSHPTSTPISQCSCHRRSFSSNLVIVNSILVPESGGPLVHILSRRNLDGGGTTHRTGRGKEVEGRETESKRCTWDLRTL